MTIVNEQWELTEDSLRGRGSISYYEIEASRLTDTGEFSPEIYDWPQHIAKKQNFDYNMFVEAYEIALDHFAGRYSPPVDKERLSDSVTAGRAFAETR